MEKYGRVFQCNAKLFQWNNSAIPAGYLTAGKPMGFRWNSTKKIHPDSTEVPLEFLCKNGQISRWNPNTAQIPSPWKKNLIPCGIPVKCWQNSRHPAVLTSGEADGIVVECDKNITEIPGRFQWTSGRISKKNSPENSTVKFRQISWRNPSRIPMLFR